LIETAAEINNSMPQYVVDRTAALLNEQGISLKNSKILMLGVAYKQDIDDFRESPALDVIKSLEKAYANVDFYDPHIPEYNFRGMNKGRHNKAYT
jgi:UDP-N-acetyl-D-glucosamine dehydrogenase